MKILLSLVFACLTLAAQEPTKAPVLEIEQKGPILYLKWTEPVNDSKRVDVWVRLQAVDGTELVKKMTHGKGKPEQDFGKWQTHTPDVTTIYSVSVGSLTNWSNEIKVQIKP